MNNTPPNLTLEEVNGRTPQFYRTPPAPQSRDNSSEVRSALRGYLSSVIITCYTHGDPIASIFPRQLAHDVLLVSPVAKLN